MNIQKALKISRLRQENKNMDSAEIAAETILAHILKKDLTFVLAHPEKKINFWQSLQFRRSLARLVSGMPLAYILGHKEFYGLDFIVNKNVLIPRPETELMVEEALKRIKNEELRIKNIIDIGTGSGCVIVSLAKNTGEIAHKTNFYGLDVSRRALKVAKINARKNNLAGRIHFLYSDLLNVIDFKKINRPILITANLPYLTPDQVKNSPSIKKEPKLALLAGSDGLDYYRRLFAQIKDRDKIVLLCEIDETQKEAMKKLIVQMLPGAEFKIINDIGGFPRLAIINTH
jgi:release factor glutamine methyltransferase